MPLVPKLLERILHISDHIIICEKYGEGLEGIHRPWLSIGASPTNPYKINKHQTALWAFGGFREPRTVRPNQNGRYLVLGSRQKVRHRDDKIKGYSCLWTSCCSTAVPIRKSQPNGALISFALQLFRYEPHPFIFHTACTRFEPYLELQWLVLSYLIYHIIPCVSLPFLTLAWITLLYITLIHGTLPCLANCNFLPCVAFLPYFALPYSFLPIPYLLPYHILPYHTLPYHILLV